jgi:hypothetical protein
MASALFVAASEFFLGSKELDMWALPEKYEDHLKKQWQDWETMKERALAMCNLYERRGRYCYNVALYLMFLAIGCVIVPYNVTIAALVAGLGIVLETYQWFLARQRSEKE